MQFFMSLLYYYTVPPLIWEVKLMIKHLWQVMWIFASLHLKSVKFTEPVKFTTCNVGHDVESW